MNTWNNKADETLVSLYAEGENQAFNVLLNRYKDKLYSYIYYIVRNSEMTEDIFQETFMKAIITMSELTEPFRPQLAGKKLKPQLRRSGTGQLQTAENC